MRGRALRRTSSQCPTVRTVKGVGSATLGTPGYCSCVYPCPLPVPLGRPGLEAERRQKSPCFQRGSCHDDPKIHRGACVSSRKDHYSAMLLRPMGEPGSLSLPRTRSLREILHRGQFRPCLVQVHLQRGWGETLWKRKIERCEISDRRRKSVTFAGGEKTAAGELVPPRPAVPVAKSHGPASASRLDCAEHSAAIREPGIQTPTNLLVGAMTRASALGASRRSLADRIDRTHVCA